MNKADFILDLSQRLTFLPQEDVQERIDFYIEMIDDRMDEGLTEEDAVAQVGSVDSIVSQIISETSLTRLIHKKLKRKKERNTWGIVLLVFCSPMWLTFLIAAAAVIFALYVSLWSVILSLWAIFVSLIGCVIGGLISGVILLCTGHVPGGIVMLAAGIVCAGLSVFTFFGCKAVTDGFIQLTKKLAVWIKNRFN